MSADAAAIFNGGRQLDYGAAGLAQPSYWWKPGLVGRASTEAGDITLTLPNLANGAAPDGRPLAGDGVSRMDGDMIIYPGRWQLFDVPRQTDLGVGHLMVPYTKRDPNDPCGGASKSPYTAWHPGTNAYAGLLQECLEFRPPSLTDRQQLIEYVDAFAEIGEAPPGQLRRQMMKDFRDLSLAAAALMLFPSGAAAASLTLTSCDPAEFEYEYVIDSETGGMIMIGSNTDETILIQVPAETGSGTGVLNLSDELENTDNKASLMDGENVVEAACPTGE